MAGVWGCEGLLEEKEGEEDGLDIGEMWEERGESVIVEEMWTGRCCCPGCFRHAERPCLFNDGRRCRVNTNPITISL